MKISYWSCKYSDYEESWDGEETMCYYFCSHPEKDGICDAEKQYDAQECSVAELDKQ